jgi:hypothetical protein
MIRSLTLGLVAPVSFVSLLGLCAACSAGSDNAQSESASNLSASPALDSVLDTAAATASDAGTDARTSTSPVAEPPALDASSAATRLVGEASSADIAVGFVAQGDRIAAFFCGGAQSFAADSHWFRGPGRLDGRTYVLRAADGWAVQFMGTSEGARGILARPGRARLRWTALPATPGTLEGLYDGRDPQGLAGLVVRPAGTPDGGMKPQGAFRTLEERFFQIEPSVSFGGVDGTLSVFVNMPDGLREMLVTRTSLAIP